MSSQFVFQDIQQLNENQALRTFTPQREIQTSQSKRSTRQTSIPKSLQIELKRQRDTFMTEISYNTDQNSISNNSQFFNQNNYSTRNISTAASGSFRQKILKSRKPIDFAIKTFQNASTRLEKFFNSAYIKTEQKEKEDDLSDLENFKIKTTQKDQKKGVEHGILRKGTFKRSTTQQNLAVTLSHIPILLDSLDQMEKEEQLPEEVKLLQNTERLRQIVKKIDYSKQVNILAPIFQSKVYESRKQDNQLNFIMRKSTSKLHQLKMQEKRINNPLVIQEITSLKATIIDIEKQIEELENQINDQEMYLVSKQHMKDIRYKDMILKREENINLLRMSTHLNRFLNKEAETLIVDSKYLDSIFVRLLLIFFNFNIKQKTLNFHQYILILSFNLSHQEIEKIKIIRIYKSISNNLQIEFKLNQYNVYLLFPFSFSSIIITKQIANDSREGFVLNYFTYFFKFIYVKITFQKNIIFYIYKINPLPFVYLDIKFLQKYVFKQITQKKSKMVQEHKNKQNEQKRQSIMTKDMENRKFNESEVDRLIKLEMKMREYEKKEEYTQKKEEFLEKKRAQNREIESIMEQQKEYNSIINKLENQFIKFHSLNKDKIASSYLDLLQFCIHVKQSTLNLKYEKEVFQRNVDELKSEVTELEKELQTLKLQNSFDQDIEKDRIKALNKKQQIVQESEIIFNKQHNKNSHILSLDKIEQDNFEIQKIIHVNKTKEQFTNNNVFNCINGLNDLHTLFFNRLNHIPFDVISLFYQSQNDLIKLKKKQFNPVNLEQAISSFSNSIKSLIDIIEEKKGNKNLEKSLDIEEMSDRIDTIESQDQKNKTLKDISDINTRMINKLIQQT